MISTTPTHLALDSPQRPALFIGARKGGRREWSAKPGMALIVFNQILEFDFVSLHNRPANRICHNGAAAS
jgi:hypothetical protein